MGNFFIWCRNNKCALALGVLGMLIFAVLLFLSYRLFVLFPGARILEGTLS